MKKFTIYEVGKPFPGAFPKESGCIMEIGDMGQWCIIIQFPDLTSSEKKMFKKSFKQYSYIEIGDSVPLAMWVFDFPKPFDKIEVNFDAKKLSNKHPLYMDAFLEKQNGALKNSITFYLLDGPILKAQKLVGLHQEALQCFHNTIEKQLKSEYSPELYRQMLNTVYNTYTTDDLARMGKIFKFKK